MIDFDLVAYGKKLPFGFNFLFFLSGFEKKTKSVINAFGIWHIRMLF